MTFRRYESYRDSDVAWLGELPSHWTINPLKAVASWNDDVLPETTQPTQKIEYVEISGVDAVRGITETTVLPFGSAPSRARRRVKHGDVLISTVRTYLRAIAPVMTPPENLVVSTGFAVVRPRDADSGFLGYALRSEPFIAEVISRSVGVSYPAINASDLVRICIPTPPRSEQIAIAAFLDRETAKIDALVEAQRRLIELLGEKRQAVISHAVTKGLDPSAPMKDSGFEWLGEVPAHWEVTALKRINPDVTVGIVVEPSKYYAERGVPALRSLNIRQGRIDLDDLVYISDTSNDLLGKSRLRAGDIVVVRTGQPGTAAVVPPELDGCNCIDLIIIRRSARSDERYLCWYLAAEAAQQQVLEGAGGAIQQHFNIGAAVQLMVSLPPRPEQERVAEFLDREAAQIDSLVAQAESAIALLQERRAALISSVVTGKIDVRGFGAKEKAA